MSKPVLLIRAHGNEEDAQALADIGVRSLIDPYLQISAADDAEQAKTLLSLLTSSPDPLWLIATSTNAIDYWAQLIGEELLRQSIVYRKNLQFAAIGERTSDTLRQYGARQILVPTEATSLALANLLISEHPRGYALIPGGNLAMKDLPTSLSTVGWHPTSAVVYTTKTVMQVPVSAQLLRDQEIAAVLLRSPSAVRALTHFVSSPKIPLVCAGETTARAVEAQGLTVAAISSGPTPRAVADTLRELLER